MPPIFSRVVCPTAATVVAVALTGCSSDGDRTAELPPGVLLQSTRDVSDEPDDVRFAAVPDLLITEDGRVIYAAPESVAIQGELLDDVWVQTITPAGIATVDAAIEAGTAPTDIEGLIALTGAELSTPEYFLPDRYRFAAVATGPVETFEDPDTPIVMWPDTASLRLADVEGCTTLPELEVGEAFETAAADSVFVDDGIVYAVVAAPDWPGAPCEVPD